MLIPYTAEELIEQLDKLYPERTPSIDMSDREIWMYAGKRELIRVLLESLKQQEEGDNE